jgi:hypothetical protein
MSLLNILRYDGTNSRAWWWNWLLGQSKQIYFEQQIGLLTRIKPLQAISLAVIATKPDLAFSYWDNSSAINLQTVQSVDIEGYFSLIDKP